MNRYLLLIALFLFSCTGEYIQKTVHPYLIEGSKYDSAECKYFVYYDAAIYNKNYMVKELIKGSVNCNESELDLTLQYVNHIVDSVALEGKGLINKENNPYE